MLIFISLLYLVLVERPLSFHVFVVAVEVVVVDAVEVVVAVVEDVVVVVVGYRC